MGENVVCVAKFKAKDGSEKELLTALKSLLEPTRSEEGCISYDLFQGMKDSAVFTMIEKFKDKEAFDFHSKQPYLAEFQKKAGSLIEKVSIDLYKETES